MESIPETTKPARPRILPALFFALWMSFVALMVWFLSSSNAGGIGLAETIFNALQKGATHG